MRTIVIAILATLTLISMTLMKTGVNIYNINTGAILLALVIAYLVFCFGTVEPDEVAMMTVWGKPVKNLGKGVYFAPAGIVSVRKESGTIFQDELPADPEMIYRGEDKPPAGMYPPIRVKFGQPDPKDTALADDPYNVPMVAEVVPVVSWHITDAITFFQVMGTTANCRKQMADKAVEVFGNKFAKITPAKAALALGKTSKDLEKKLRGETIGWGIQIDDAFVKPIIFSHALNKAVESVGQAREAAKATVLTAEGEKKKRIEEATGAAEAVRLSAAAEKARLVSTGLAKTDASGNITELVPDANIRVQTEAIKDLGKVTGTLVLGNPNTMLGIPAKGGDK